MKTQEVTKTETCYKCNGDCGEQLEDGWMPCYRCGTTGVLPLGTRASLCDCDHGDVRGEDYDDGTPCWTKCDKCVGGVKLVEVPEPKKMACGHYSHEDGGPSDYPDKCRISKEVA